MDEDKRIRIFKAVLELAREDNPFSSIRISAVAERAGIGKGTVYEYFHSKDDMMREAQLYFARKALGMLKAANTRGGFKQRVMFILETAQTHISRNMLVMVRLMQGSPCDAAMEDMRSDFAREVEALMACGVSEGAVAPCGALRAISAVIAALVCLVMLEGHPGDFAGERLATSGETAYAVLTGSLAQANASREDGAGRQP